MTYDYTDAPPPDDFDAPTFNPGLPTPNDYVLKLANAIDRLAAVLERQISPGGAPASALSQPPGPPNGAPAPPPGGSSNETQVKRGKKIYAVCMSQDPPRDVKQIGEHVTGHTLAKNSQQWAEADQVAVLEAFKDWGWG